MPIQNNPEDLNKATKDGDLEKVTQLLAAHADVNYKDSADNTALIWAAYYGYN